jgi:hypothetical protein
MGYTILHNRQDAQSRDFVAGLPEADHTIIEWYTDVKGVAAYQAAHPGLHPSAFPSVLVRVPAYREPETIDPATGETLPARNVAAHHKLLRCPASLAEVEAYVEMVGQRAVDQPVE